MLRSFAESALRGISFRRRLPEAFGGAPIVVSPSCGLRYLVTALGRVDPSLLRWAESLVSPGAVVWDVGANLGLFSFAAANRAGKTGSIIAFEPDAQLVTMLRKSATMQPAASAPVTIVPAACGRAVEPRTFHLATRSRSSNYLEGYGTTQTGGSRGQHTVMAITLDWALGHFPRPAIVKIDVEGAEVEVFSGATQLLSEVRPMIICEVSGDRSAEIAAILHSHRYRITNAERPDDGADLAHAPWNTLAVPR